MSRTGQSMNRWIPIAIITVLVVALAVTATLMGLNIRRLHGQIKDADDQIAGINSQLSSAQNNASSLQTQLTQEKGTTSSLQAQVTSLKGQVDNLGGNVASLQQTSSQQAAEIETMSYPRNFTSVDELTNWLQKANPIQVGVDTYSLTSLQKAQMALALEVKASRDGYILPVVLPLLGTCLR